MNNKVLVKLLVPELDASFDVFIPVNEVVWRVKKIMAKSIFDLTNGDLDVNKEYVLINKLTSKFYENNSIIIDTDIRNATELIFLSIKDSDIIEMIVPRAI